MTDHGIPTAPSAVDRNECDDVPAHLNRFGFYASTAEHQNGPFSTPHVLTISITSYCSGFALRSLNCLFFNGSTGKLDSFFFPSFSTFFMRVFFSFSQGVLDKSNVPLFFSYLHFLLILCAKDAGRIMADLLIVIILYPHDFL